MDNQPYEKDIAWLKKGFIFKHGVEPTESKIDCFVEKVAIFFSEDYDEVMNPIAKARGL
jgi:hypothetical protein